MALPLLNEQPIYELSIPSTGEKKKFRPFLVREERNLLIANESKDPKQIFNAVIQCINNCVIDIEVEKLSTFDADYIFAQIRAKSVGETTTILPKCESCDQRDEVAINIQDIKVDLDKKVDSRIKITNNIVIQMKYPSYDDFIKADLITGDLTIADATFKTIYACLDSVHTDDERISIKDESKADVENFINSLTTEQFQKITNFIESIPSVSIEHDWKCTECGHDNKIVVKGIQDFF